MKTVAELLIFIVTALVTVWLVVVLFTLENRRQWKKILSVMDRVEFVEFEEKRGVAKFNLQTEIEGKNVVILSIWYKLNNGDVFAEDYTIRSNLNVITLYAMPLLKKKVVRELKMKIPSHYMLQEKIIEGFENYL